MPTLTPATTTPQAPPVMPAPPDAQRTIRARPPWRVTLDVHGFSGVHVALEPDHRPDPPGRRAGGRVVLGAGGGLEPFQGGYGCGCGGHGCHTSPQSPHSSAYPSVRSPVVTRISLMVSALPQAGQAGIAASWAVKSATVANPSCADATGAAPVPGGGGVGVVAGDDGVAALAAAEDVDAAGQAVLCGVEVFVADDGFDVIQDGDGHGRVSFCA